MTKEAAYRPVLRNRCVELERSRLLNHILPEFQHGNLLMLTSGPGTGKTFLIHQLLRHRKGMSAYLDLKKLSSDITIFVRQLEYLFAKLWPDVFSDLGSDRTNQSINKLSPKDRVDNLLDQLFISGDQPAVFALDGCDILAERPSWAELVSLLLQRLPSFVSIILASTSPLKFSPLSTFRVQGKMLELTVKELHFDSDEIWQFLSKNIPGLKKEHAQKIEQKVGGWPAGLSLLCCEFREKGEIIFLDSISPENLFDYLQSEVLAGLSQEVMRILCTAALLQPFDYTLLEKFLPVSCERLIEIFSSYSFLLDRMADENDSEGAHFAQLYANFFYGRAEAILGKQAKKKLHKKAASYFQNSGLTDQALVHMIALENWSSAVKLILADHKSWFNKEDYERLLFWADQLPESLLLKHPRLAILQGHAHLYLGNLDEAVKVFSLAHDCARPNSKDWLESGCRLCEVLLLKGRLREGVDLAGKLAERSRFISRYRAEAMMFKAIGLNLLCRFDECDQLWRHISTIANSRFLPLDQTARCYLMAPKVIFYNLERGKFDESEHILDRAISVFHKKDPRKRLGWILLFKGVLKLELHQYSEAVTWFREAVAISSKTNRSVHAGCTAFLSYILAALGHKKEARLWYERAEPLVSRDLTLWAPVLCALVRVHLSEQPEGAVRELKLAWNLACQRNILVPLSLVAYTAFAVHDKVSCGPLAASICSQAADTCRKWNVYHREARILLYLHLLQNEPGKEEKSESFIRAMTLISQKELGFLLTDDKRIDGLALTIQAIKQGIATDYFLELCRVWGGKAYEALVPLFPKSNLDLKEKIAALWAQNCFRSAIPLIEQAIQTVKRKKSVTEFSFMLQQLKAFPPEPLHVRLFGTFSLARGEEKVPDQAWKRLKAKELFKLLCLYPDTSFTHEQLSEIFWPESTTDKARANLWSTVSALRSVIEPELSARTKSSYLQGDSRTYKLQLPADSTIDTILFEEKTHEGFHYKESGDYARALFCFEEAVDLYKSELLPEDLYTAWSAEPRERFGLLFTRVLRGMAAIYFERKDLGECIRLYSKIISLDPWDEASYLVLMQCYVLQGRDLEAIKVFRRCEEILQKELNVAPDQQLRDLLKRILKRRSNIS